MYNECEDMKILLFKDKFLKLNREMMKQNKAEAIFLNATNVNYKKKIFLYKFFNILLFLFEAITQLFTRQSSN